MVEKISIIGAGQVGRLISFLVLMRNLAREILMVDIRKEMVQALSLDLEDSRFFFSSNTKVLATDDLTKIKSSQIIVITAGKPRSPGMSREELVKFNASLVKKIAKKIKKYAPNSIVIVVTNPVDLMTYLVLKTTNFSKEKVIGMGSSLDSARLANLISKRLNIDIRGISPVVLGAHGKNMLISRITSLYGLSLEGFLKKNIFQQIKKETIDRGAKIVSLLKEGSARFAPASAVLRLLEAIIFDKKELIFCSVYLQGEFSLKNISLGVPVIVSKKGIEKILEIPLPREEMLFLKKAEKEFKETLHSFQRQS